MPTNKYLRCLDRVRYRLRLCRQRFTRHRQHWTITGSPTQSLRDWQATRDLQDLQDLLDLAENQARTGKLDPEDLKELREEISIRLTSMLSNSESNS